MYTFANPSMISQLKDIWQECFGDEMEYIDFFFDNILKKAPYYKNLLVALDGIAPVCMLTMIPAWIQLKSKKKKVYYIYGVATTQSHRGRGYAAGLLAYAGELAQKEDAALMLVPASESLFTYYEKLGFATGFYIKKETYDRKEENEKIYAKEKESNILKFSPTVQVSEIEEEAYFSLRMKQIKDVGDIYWEEEEIHYALLENAFLGGKSYRITCEDVDYLLLGCPYDSCYYIREHTLPENVAKEVFFFLAKQNQCSSISIKSKVSVLELQQREPGNHIVPYGMILPKEASAQIANGYLGLALD